MPLPHDKALVVRCPSGCEWFTFDCGNYAAQQHFITKDSGVSKMIAISLQSGSDGNCIYVEGGGVRLLFDAGLGGREAERRLRSYGRDIRQTDAVIVSHEHWDHVRCAGVLNRMFGLPLYITRETLEAAAHDIGRIDRVHYFQAGDTLQFGEVAVETIPTPHDAADGVAFVVMVAGRRLGILTDVGHVFKALEELTASLDAVFIESNYDAHMLENGPYPPFLKERIRGPAGHLSNAEAATLLRRSAGKRLKWACLAHLSETNNSPELALETHRRTWAKGLPLRVASRYSATGTFEI